MQLGYNPDRIRVLSRRTAASIDDIASIHCSDQAATTALRALRLLRRNLEDHWMPLLREIESSDAMIGWRSVLLGANAGGLEQLRQEWANSAAWLDFDESSPNVFSTLTDDELIHELTAASNFHQTPHWEQRAVDIDLVLTREVARRVRSDPAFADYLVFTADAHTVVGAMLASGLFDADFATNVVRTMVLSPSHRYDALNTPLGIDTGLALDFLAGEHPDRSLELLADHDIASTLVPGLHNQSVSSDAIENFTTSALAASVLLDERQLDKSFEALAQIIDIAGTSAVEVGVLRGVINSLVVHLPTLAPYSTDGSLNVRPEGSDVTIGSYDELKAFYGQAMGDAQAQGVAGGLISAFLDEQMRRVGPDSLDRQVTATKGADPASLLGQTASTTSKVVDLLLVDGLASEQQRRHAVAGANHAATEGWITLFTAPVSVLIPALGAGRGIKTVFKITQLGAEARSGPEPDEVADQGYRFTVPDQVRATTIELIIPRPELRTLATLETVSDEGWVIMTSIAAQLAITPSMTERTELLRRLGELDDVDRTIVDMFLARAVDHSNAQPNADKSPGRSP